MIKILVISTVGLGMYGITNSIMNYYRALDKSDLQIDFLSPSDVPDNLKEEISNNRGIVYERVKRNYHPISYIRRLTRILKKGQYDIVHVHGNSRTLVIELKAAKLCGVKVRIAHSHNSTCDHRLLNRLLKHSFDGSYTQGFACSRKAGLWLYGIKPFTVINNAIPVSKFFYNEEMRKIYRRKLGMENNKIIGHVGHFSYQKNQEFLIRVFSEIYKKDPSYRLILVGDGKLKNKNRLLVKKLGLSKIICFCRETVHVNKLLQAMDIFVFPSRFEGLGIAVIEAQTAGLPCVVSDSVPIEAKISENMAFLSLKEEKEDWADQIMRFGNPDREKCSSQNRELVQSSVYNIESEAVKLKNLYISFFHGE